MSAFDAVQTPGLGPRKIRDLGKWGAGQELYRVIPVIKTLARINPWL